MFKKLLIVALVLFASIANAQISTVSPANPLSTLGNPVISFLAVASPSITLNATTTPINITMFQTGIGSPAVNVGNPFPAGTKRLYLIAGSAGGVNIGNASCTSGTPGPFITIAASGQTDFAISPSNLSPAIYACPVSTSTTLYVLPMK